MVRHVAHGARGLAGSGRRGRFAPSDEMMDYRLLVAAFGATIILLPVPASTQEDENEVEFSFNGRVRVEGVEEDNALRDATSSTLRIRAGLTTPTYSGWSGLAEIEAIENVGGDDFNSGSNGRTAFSAVLDHEDVEINQLAVGYRDISTICCSAASVWCSTMLVTSGTWRIGRTSKRSMPFAT